MKNARLTIWLVAVAVLVMVSGVQAAFILENNDYLKVNTSYTDGVLYDYSTADVVRGQMHRVYVFDNATLNVLAGTITNLRAYNNGTVNLSSGRVSDLRAYNTSTVNIFGYDFRASGGANIIDNKVIGSGVLTGKWHNGDIFVIAIPSYSATATILLIPEPTTLLLLGLGGLAVFKRKSVL